MTKRTNGNNDIQLPRKRQRWNDDDLDQVRNSQKILSQNHMTQNSVNGMFPQNDALMKLAKRISATRKVIKRNLNEVRNDNVDSMNQDVPLNDMHAQMNKDSSMNAMPNNDDHLRNGEQNGEKNVEHAPKISGNVLDRLQSKQTSIALPQSNGSQPLFLTKEKREELRRMEEEKILRRMELERQMQKEEELPVIHNHMTEQEILEIKNTYIGANSIRKDKRKSKKIVEDWDAKDDTSLNQPNIIERTGNHIVDDLGGVSKNWRDKRLDEMTNRDWRAFREEFEIRSRGGPVPNPIRNWEEANIPEALKKSIREARYRKPTPIQMQCVPLAFTNRDILGVAETGSGKTAAFVIPLLAAISKLPHISPENARNGPYALLLAPTRELVQQIENEIRKLSKYLDIRVMYVIGGENIQDQQLELSKGIEILVATPGRLVDLLDTRYISLSQCRYMVLDEADRMCSMNYEDDLLYILGCMPDNDSKVNRRQTVMFSATMPAAVEKLASQYLKGRVLVSIGEIGRINENIQLVTLWMDESSKNKQLYNILQRANPPIIIFVNERRKVDTLYQYLRGLKFSCIAIHGGKSQHIRESSIQSFKNGNAEILIATDLAGRGLDIEGISLVVNYDMPDDISKFKHRVGRTGRAGAKGKAISFLTEKDTQIMYDLKRILRASNANIPPELLMADASRAPERVHRAANEEGS